MSEMDVNINFYGHSVTVDPDDIADSLDKTASKAEISKAVSEAISAALEHEPYPDYRADKSGVVDKVLELLAKREENEEIQS